ncbi:MAG: citrate lyase subunit alpha [Treponema sp.]|jgi:citrate lyase subunit alpha/citrate CoA-transferase|nr:citrate lyase subunit alpha [Treponema sp.]
MSKLVSGLREAVQLCGLRDGMTISFHHHLRNGDFVLNMVCDELSDMGFKDLTINASAIHEGHGRLVEHLKSGVVTGIETNYMGSAVGRYISEGRLKKPVIFRTHGGRPSDIERGKSHIDVAFIAAPSSDCMGNCTGKFGPSACGSLGYAFADAEHADRVIIITDNLVPYPLAGFSISEVHADYVVSVDSIGDPAGIASSTTRMTRDPIALLIADYAAKVIRASGYLKDGFSFQTGAGGASLAAASFLKRLMQEQNIKGSYAMGGITGYIVDMLEAGCFETLADVQCFDLRAVESLNKNPRHREVTASHYASPTAKSSLVGGLDTVILGATEIDTQFNVNVHTDSRGYIMGGSGGHSDTAAGAKLAIIVAPLTRARLPLISDRVNCISTPGSTIDVLVTQFGIAVNPSGGDLALRLSEAGLPVRDIRDLKKTALEISGVPKPFAGGDREVARVLYRDGTQIDTIRNAAV